MAKCKFRLEGTDWECPLDAIPGEDYCYWHLPKDGKEPTREQLEELKVNGIFGVYLKEANLRVANLQETNLWNGNLRGICLEGADLKNADLYKADLHSANLLGADLQNAYLLEVDLRNANLSMANLQNTNLMGAHIQNANLSVANLHNTDLYGADIQRTNLFGVMLTSQTSLQYADLRYANLYLSYVDRTLTLRDAEIFDEKYRKEINELVADFSKKRSVIDFEELQQVNKELALDAFDIGGCYVLTGIRVIPFDSKKGFLLSENKDDKILKIEGKLRKVFQEKGDKILYLPDKETLKDLYDASYEVYNKLYYFYIQAGKLEEALEMHYRRNEVRRKKRLLAGVGNKIRAVLYDWILMKTLTGYGVKVERPLIASLATIGIFTLLFKLTNGIVKVVDGKPIKPGWFDYLYHSVITFTSLGYSNIQPNLNGHLPQLLVSVESFLGILMMSLFLYTVTFRISR
ncbi:pentapeptide repeat-containing protein [Thermococcus sp. 21S7]|uniref:pentapeptide repeat-containing protein n=1 Tax=Thermococcus sp. 21S7 TaxID=1638221 RepID=UPI00143B60C6|nr:pentapeptide repeat-containing protein [Thermococcus sp. 21S7]NJE60157.1 hypothetical protein [Thermococcus sp. 21S7]